MVSVAVPDARPRPRWMRAFRGRLSRGRPIGMAAARRGATIVEALLYLSVAAGVIVFTGRVLQGEQVRQRNQIVAADVQMVLDATQLYVAQYYDAIVADLFDDTELDADMLGEFGLAPMIEVGFLPALFTSGSGGLRGIYGQDYFVLHRAVLRSNPGVTVQRTVDTINDRAELTDGEYVATQNVAGDLIVTNDEVDLEVLLVTLPTPGGAVDPPLPIEPQNGNRIVELTGRPATGFVQPPFLRGAGTDPVATGAYNGWNLNLSQFEALRPEIDNGGILASIIALPITGVVSVLADARDRENLSRCADVAEFSAVHRECLAASAPNALYSNLVFNTWDSDGDGVIDGLPGLDGVYQISFGDPLDTDGAAGADTFGEITNLFALSCHAADGGAGAADATPAVGELDVNCPTTRLRGTVVAPSATVQGLLDTQDLVVAGQTQLRDVTMSGGLFLEDAADPKDLLDQVPVWSRRVIFNNFSEQPSMGTQSRNQNITTLGSNPFHPDMCPATRPPVLTHSLVGYEFSGSPTQSDLQTTDILSVNVTAVNTTLTATITGRWPLPIRVIVMAEVYCRSPS